MALTLSFVADAVVVARIGTGLEVALIASVPVLAETLPFETVAILGT